MNEKNFFSEKNFQYIVKEATKKAIEYKKMVDGIHNMNLTGTLTDEQMKYLRKKIDNIVAGKEYEFLHEEEKA